MRTSLANFKKIIKERYRAAGRHGLPWRKTRDPYAILVSEVMLQQTQVARVEGYYGRWLKKFPNVASLARAKTGDVLAAWQGLGYNRRALALHKLAGIVVREYGGALPKSREALEKLPGIGKGTSGSLMAFAFNMPEIFIETNIRRVFIHFFFPKSRRGVTDAELERYIKQTIDRKHPREWYWAIMDYGAAMAVKNPNRRSAHYKKQSAFKGSGREIRGKIVRYLLASPSKKGVRAKSLASVVGVPEGGSFKEIISRLVEEGFIIEKSGFIQINQR